MCLTFPCHCTTSCSKTYSINEYMLFLIRLYSVSNFLSLLFLFLLDFLLRSISIFPVQSQCTPTTNTICVSLFRNLASCVNSPNTGSPNTGSCYRRATRLRDYWHHSRSDGGHDGAGGCRNARGHRAIRDSRGIWRNRGHSGCGQRGARGCGGCRGGGGESRTGDWCMRNYRSQKMSKT